MAKEKRKFIVPGTDGIEYLYSVGEDKARGTLKGLKTPKIEKNLRPNRDVQHWAYFQDN